MNNTVFFEIQNNIAFITLNRPEVFNSFNRTMALALQEIIKDLNDNDSLCEMHYMKRKFFFNRSSA